MLFCRHLNPLVFAAAFVANVAVPLSLALAETTDKVEFDRQIRPILSENCFSCHGPDSSERKADLRLDQRDAALAHGAITFDVNAESELVKRIYADDVDTIMPPPDSHKTLTAEQKELIKRWISQGAEYTQHWAFVAPAKKTVPDGANPIDYFVEQKLASEGLSFAPTADPVTLARRLSLDLVGLPPSKNDVKRMSDQPTDASASDYVERLLASPHYGERMAISWLDVVRFADTIGYHSDTPRNIYPYRDYVIACFNSNKSFDQFTIEQIAGDLLPGATLEQKVASGFNRLLLTTEEGGAQAKDYEARYLGDRVRSIGTAWLGLTIGCSQCHDHKFDPITSRDFYSMGAFFADIDEAIIGRREEGIEVLSNDQLRKLQHLKVAASQLAAELAADHPELASQQTVWEQQQLAIADAQNSWQPLAIREAKSAADSTLTITDERSVLASGNRPDKDTYVVTLGTKEPLARAIGLQIQAIPHDSLPQKGSGRAGNGNFVITEVVVQRRRADGTLSPIALKAARASIEQTESAGTNPYKKWTAASTIDNDEKGAEWGWAVLPEANKPQRLQLTFADPLAFAADEALIVDIRQNHGGDGHLLGHFQCDVTEQTLALEAPLIDPVASDLVKLIRTPKEQRSPEQSAQIHRAFVAVATELALLRQQLVTAQKMLAEYDASLPRTLISISLASPRTVRILPRGNFLDESGEVVGPALPGFLTMNQRTNRKQTRLDLAQWIASRDNPLTARVFVNRLWKQFFGIGLAKNLDDLGAQGEAAANPELLDYLAVEFMDSGWDIKHIVRLIVNSRSYRQASTAAPELLIRDPENRLVARQGRFRLPAELVRDSALSISGLLSLDVGGPSVKPYQPENYWENLNFPQRTYQADSGTSQFRRGLYTWWQRSFVHPSMLAFDAPTREECTADRTQSNIPQQALVLLNDPTYVEAARAFASRIVAEGGGDASSRIAWAFENATSRAPSSGESTLLAKLYESSLVQYQADPAAASSLLKVGQSSVAIDEGKTVELATWVQVARAILNLHEVITRN